MVEKWRKLIFANAAEDPVREVVSYAIEKFGSEKDRLLWTWYANRIGVNTFLQRVFEIEACSEAGEIDSPVRVFHTRLQDDYRERFPKPSRGRSGHEKTGGAE